MEQDTRTTISRREFIGQSGRLAGVAALAAAATRAYAAPDDTIGIALIGCGGRGTGAALNALGTPGGPTRLVAMADVFEDKLRGSLDGITGARPDQVDVPPERQFVGFDGYRGATDAVGEGGVVILATPPAFRPLHLDYAVDTGRHVFMEKAFAVDGPGIRRVLAAGQRASEKGLRIAGGLMSRHSAPLEEAINRIHDGEIGEVITCWAYRMHQPVGYAGRVEGESELAHQIRNYSNFTWLNGSFMLDWLIHNLDVCCWVKDSWPASAQGQGGRQAREAPDQLFDHYAAEFTFEDGTRLFAQGRHIENCFGFFGCVIHGSTGCAVLGEGIPNPRLYRGWRQDAENLIWQHEGPAQSPYDREHELLFASIREDTPYNESERCAYAALTGILGRMACESGRVVTWEEALASELELAPGLGAMTWQSEPPVVPDAAGAYPVAMPGRTVAL